MNNKELIKKLKTYFLEKCDPDVVAHFLAASMVDMNRLLTMDLLPEEERRCLIARMRHNAQQLNTFAKDESPSPLTLEIVNRAEDVK